MPSPIDKIAIIGTGVIGAGWTLRLLAKKKEIYPQKKPTKEIEIIAKTLEEDKESEIIYPQKKPVLFQKKIDKAVAKSTILSTGDLKIAKAAFEAVK